MPPKGRTTKPTEPVSESENSDSEPEVVTKPAPKPTKKAAPATEPKEATDAKEAKEAKPRAPRKPHEFSLDCLKLDEDYKVPDEKKTDLAWIGGRLHQMMEQRDEVTRLVSHCMQVVKTLTAACDRYAKLSNTKPRKPRDPSAPERKKSGVNKELDIPEVLAKFITKHKNDIVKIPKGKEQYEKFEGKTQVPQTNIATLLFYLARATGEEIEVNGKTEVRMSDAVWKTLRVADLPPNKKTGHKFTQDDPISMPMFVSITSRFYPKNAATKTTTEVNNTVDSGESGESGESESEQESGSESEGEAPPKRAAPAPAPAPARKPRKAA